MMMPDSANLTPTVILEVFCCGIFSLLYGVHLITDTIQREAGLLLRRSLLQMTRHPYGAFSFGMLLTMVTQSGGATSSLLVGLVNTEVLPLSIAIAALLGSNVGSAVALQLLALHLTRFALVFVGFGMAAALLTQQTRRRGLGQVCFGFGLIVFGLAILEVGGDSLAVNPMTTLALETLAPSPFLLALGGMLLSMLFSSSIVGIGLVIVLASKGTLPIDAAVAFLLGANVGSTMIAFLTALLKGSIPGRRLALIHTGTKLIGATIILGALGPLSHILHWIPLPPGMLVAMVHLGFNMALALLFVPCAGWLASLAERCLFECKWESLPGDTVFTLTPSLPPGEALEKATHAVFHMTELVTQMLTLSIQAFEESGREIPARLSALDDQLDLLNARIKRALISLDEENMTDEQKRRRITLLYLITDLEAMGDQLDKQYMSLARRKHSQQLVFSAEGRLDLMAYHQEVSAAIQQTVTDLLAQDTDLGEGFLLRQRELVQKKRMLQLNHVQELRRSGPLSQASSALYLDVLTTLGTLLSHTTTMACAKQEEVFLTKEIPITLHPHFAGDIV